MSEMTIKRGYEPRAKGESVALFFVCVISTTLVGWLIAFLSGSMDAIIPISAPRMPGVTTASIIWTVCYILIGISLYLILSAWANNSVYRKVKGWAITLWSVQIVMLYTLPFFMYMMQEFMLSFVWLAVLDAVVIALIVVCLKLRPLSGLMLIPYMAWLGFMTYGTLYLALYIV